MSENTQKLYLVPVRADGSAIPVSATGVQPSRNCWGESKYSFYFDFNPGTGTPGTCSAQVETADGSGADGTLRWGIVGTSQSLSNATPSTTVIVNGALVKNRLNVTAFANSSNSDASLVVAAVMTHD